MNCIHPVALCCAMALSSQAATLSGFVVDQDSLPVAGVVVSLSSVTSPVTTGADGAWSFAVADGIASRTRVASNASNARVLVDGDHLRLSLGGYDISGRPLATAVVAKAPEAAANVAARSSGLDTPDTLSLSWNGKVILRDTMYAPSQQQGIVLTFDTTLNASILYGHVADAQGHYYRTVRIAGHAWTAQNLNLTTDSSWCYADLDSNCHRYGRLYQWHAAMAAGAQYDQNALGGDTIAPQGICPQGWHLPRYGEWDTLFQVIGGASLAGHLLKATSGWSSMSGVDTFGLHIVPSGYRIGTGGFYQIGAYANFWSSSEFDSDAGMWYFNKSSALYDHYDKRYAYSVRCVAN